jgi:hypothetical protein
MLLTDAGHRKDFKAYMLNGIRVLTTPQVTGSFGLDGLDLTAIREIHLSVFWEIKPENNYTYEVHIDGLDGEKIGEGTFKSPGKETGENNVVIPISAVNDGKFHDIYIVSRSSGTLDKGAVKLKGIVFKD